MTPKRTTLLLAALGAPALLALAAPADELTFRPAEGLSLSKTFEEVQDLTMEDMTMIMNGNDMSDMIQIEMSTTTTTSRTVLDTYVAMADGRPAKLERSFESLGSDATVDANAMGQQDVQEMEGTSELEGLTTVFSWNDEEGAFDAAFPEGEEGDEELLEGLHEDMDFRALLPEGTVAADDTWEVDPAEMIDVLAPGGDLKIVPEGMDEMMSMGPSPAGGDLSQLLGDIEGEVTAKYAGTQEVDGIQVGVIRFVVELSSYNDMTEMVQEMMGDSELPEGAGDMDIEVEAVDVEWTFAGEGELLWNLEAGHFHSFELNGDVEMTMDMAMAVTGTPMGDMSQEMSMAMAGTTSLSASAEAAE
jgi:hypothetical protein